MLLEVEIKKVILLILICLCLCCIATAQAEVRYLGEVCLTLTGTTGAPEKLQLGILSYGADTFPVYGKIRKDEIQTIVPFHGSAVVDGNTVTITLNASNMDTGLFTGTYSISIDWLTLSGTFHLITYERFKGTPTPSEPYVIATLSGTVTVALQACP